ncbi:MAG: hypothetical protein QM490_04975 [Candidatus Gracilibacteria bacterium]
MGEINLPIKKSVSNYAASILFLVTIVIITLTLHFYNNHIGDQIDDLKSDINSIESSIAEEQQDKQLQIYTLLELNKETINSYKLMNNVTKYINHMNVIASKYKLEFSGFDLVKGEISSNVKLISDKEGIAFQKTRDFINNYRIDPKALFELQFINSIEGMDDMKFRVNFKIK